MNDIQTHIDQKVIDIESIISEGRTLRKSSKQITNEITDNLIEKLMREYIDKEPLFMGRANIVKFRKFLRRNIKGK